jgi:hypothetical protein
MESNPQDLIDWLEARLIAHKWQFAKTMPWVPHYYTMIHWWDDKAEFFECVRILRTFGYDDPYFGRVHSVSGMASLVYSMLDNGWDDAAICNELGMEPEELLRLKHITGFSKLFENAEYKKAWVTRRMILLKQTYKAEHLDEKVLEV